MDYSKLKTISLEEKKQIMVALLQDIDAFCREKNITYFLYAGTLLGAVRHQGFIPWDDDIDILMPREDYERLLREYIPANEHYKLYCAEKMPGYIYAFAKLCDERTWLVEELDTDQPLGVNIDIFPLDNAGETFEQAAALGKRIKRYRKILDLKTTAVSKDRSWAKNAALRIIKAILAPASPRWLVGKMIQLSKAYRGINSLFAAEYAVMAYGNRDIFPKKCFESVCELPFEGKKYYAPTEYNEILSITYGDYMKLPPVEKRVTHHLNNVYWKEQV